MMNSKNILVATAVFSLCASQAFADAGLTGKRYLSFGGGVIDPGNEIISAIDDSIVVVGANLNIPINTNIDFRFNYKHEHMEGDVFPNTFKVRADSFTTGLQYLFNPEEKVNPFISAGLGYYKGESEIDGLEVDDSDGHVYLIGGGVEIELAKQLSITPSIAYNETGDEEDVIAGIQLNTWFTEEIFASIGTSFGFDEEDIGAFAQIGFAY